MDAYIKDGASKDVPDPGLGDHPFPPMWHQRAHWNSVESNSNRFHSQHAYKRSFELMLDPRAAGDEHGVLILGSITRGMNVIVPALF